MFTTTLPYATIALLAGLCSGCDTIPYVAPTSGPLARLRLVDVSPNPQARMILTGYQGCQTHGVFLNSFGLDGQGSSASTHRLGMPLAPARHKATEIQIPAGGFYEVTVSMPPPRAQCSGSLKFIPQENADYQIDTGDFWTSCKFELSRIEKSSDGSGYSKTALESLAPKKCP